MKRSYLLATANVRHLSQSAASAYDDALQMNVLVGGDRVPVVETEQFFRTESKTLQAPSDDDPDPDDAGCY